MWQQCHVMFQPRSVSAILHFILKSIAIIIRFLFSYKWFAFLIFRVGGKSSVDDYTLAAEACLPIISAILAEIRNQTYPQKCFLNIDLPTDVANNKVNPNYFWRVHYWMISLRELLPLKKL